MLNRLTRGNDQELLAFAISEGSWILWLRGSQGHNERTTQHPDCTEVRFKLQCTNF